MGRFAVKPWYLVLLVPLVCTASPDVLRSVQNVQEDRVSSREPPQLVRQAVDLPDPNSRLPVLRLLLMAQKTGHEYRHER